MRVPVPLSLEVAAARAAGALSRLAGRGGGTTLPGKLLWKVDPGAIDRLAARLPQGSALVSATNGKTTTAAMAAEILTGRFRLAHNDSGANLVSGVASTLLEARGAELGLFEVDEAALPEVAARVQPRAVCLGNLFRDQLDRYGELEHVADRWRAAAADLPPATVLVLDADDPQVASLADSGHESIRLRGRRRAARAARAPARGRLEVVRPLRDGVRVPRRVHRPSRRLPLPELRARPAGARRRRAGDRARGRRPRGVHARHPGGLGTRPAPPPGPLQRLQRARRGRAGPDPGLAARRDRDGARALRRSVRSLRAHRARRPAAAHAPREEPGRRERGRADAAPGRARRARS